VFFRPTQSLLRLVARSEGKVSSEISKTCKTTLQENLLSRSLSTAACLKEEILWYSEEREYFGTTSESLIQMMRGQ